MPEFDATKNIETWEITTNGTCWVLVTDPRDASGYKKVRVGGRQGGSKRVRLSTDDRRYNQEQIVDEMKGSDPFESGLLRLVDEKKVDDINATYHYSNEDLRGLLEIKDPDVFRDAIEDIKSEFIIRRLAMIAAKDGTGSQTEVLQDVIDARYQVAKEQEASQETSKGIRLS